jgi:holo-[acyl-carrier protein] synthase
MKTGVDMVDVSRFAKISLERDNRLLQRLFRSDETDVFSTPRDLAMAFALKEAVSKALGTGIASGVQWHDIQVVPRNDGHGVVLHGAAQRLAGQRCFHVSADSTDTVAVALAILEDAHEPEEEGP